MIVAGQALVPGQLDRGAPFERVVAGDLRPIADEIVQRFSLLQGAVAAVAHLESARSVDVKIRQPEGVRPALDIQSGNAGLVRQRLIGIERTDRHSIP